MTANILPPTGGRVAFKSFSLLIIESYSLGLTRFRYPSVLATLPFRAIELNIGTDYQFSVGHAK